MVCQGRRQQQRRRQEGKAHLSAFWKSIERNAPTQVGKNNQESLDLHTQLFLRKDRTTPLGDSRQRSIRGTIPVPM